LALCPGDSVKGSVIPLIAKPVPFTLTLRIVTLDVPWFTNTPGSVDVLPTATLPKFNPAGE
jgi:hypothetical protein